PEGAVAMDRCVKQTDVGCDFWPRVIQQRQRYLREVLDFGRHAGTMPPPSSTPSGCAASHSSAFRRASFCSSVFGPRKRARGSPRCGLPLLRAIWPGRDGFWFVWSPIVCSFLL